MMCSKKTKEEPNMKKISVIFVIVLLLSLAACGENGPTLPAGVSYAVQVVDGDGNPIADAMVSLCQNKEGGICYLPAKTGEDGMAYFYETAVPVQKDMKVRVLVAQGYDLPLDAAGDIQYTLIPNGTTQLTLTLNKTA